MHNEPGPVKVINNLSCTIVPSTSMHAFVSLHVHARCVLRLESMVAT